MKIEVTWYDERQRPDLDAKQATVLKNAPLSRKTATRTVPRNRHKGGAHHEALTIKTSRKCQEGWEDDEQHSVTLEGEEVQALLDFVGIARSLPRSPQVGVRTIEREPVVDAASGGSAMKHLRSLAGPEREEALHILLQQASDDPKLLRAVLDRSASDAGFLAKAAAALNLAVYEQAVAELERLVLEDSPEAEFQRLLAANPWMFGTEYARLLDGRSLTVREKQDFLLTRTTDAFLEVIEIKTPLRGEGLFGFDASHTTFYPKADLSKVVAQVENYLEQLDASRDNIFRRFGVEANKVRAKVVIGCDGDTDQVNALRRMNGHLHRIEVVTFDGLLKIARRVLTHLRGSAGAEAGIEAEP